MHVELQPFETPKDIADFIAELPEELRSPIMAIYAAGILHATEGKIVAIEIGDLCGHMGDSTNVH